MNEALFREVNERIEHAPGANSARRRSFEIVCECGDGELHRAVRDHERGVRGATRATSPLRRRARARAARCRAHGRAARTAISSSRRPDPRRGQRPRRRPLRRRTRPGMVPAAEASTEIVRCEPSRSRCSRARAGSTSPGRHRRTPPLRCDPRGRRRRRPRRQWGLSDSRSRGAFLLVQRTKEGARCRSWRRGTTSDRRRPAHEALDVGAARRAPRWST